MPNFGYATVLLIVGIAIPVLAAFNAALGERMDVGRATLFVLVGRSMSTAGIVLSQRARHHKMNGPNQSKANNCSAPTVMDTVSAPGYANCGGHDAGRFHFVVV